VVVLALDTSSPAVTVAVVASERSILASQIEVQPNRHGELLAPMIVSALTDAGRRIEDVDAVGVGLGPGPFTGLRVGIVTAQSVADALGIPVYGECSLDLIARSHASGDGTFGVVTDARRKQVYWAAYDEDAERLDGPELGRPAEVADALRSRTTVLVGAGALLYRDLLDGFEISERAPYPSAIELGWLALAKLAAGAPSDRLAPLYLRRPDAQPPGERKKVTPV
jgi:tRNA threonylcarbamoyl adenosine modification protein YeaZ